MSFGRLYVKGDRVAQRFVSALEKAPYRWGIRSTARLTLPDFLIIGAQKAGSTWLRENLACHPAIYFPWLSHRSDPTEVRYFDQNFSRSLSYYADLYRDGIGKIKGDKSPNYCVLSPRRVQFIRRILPNARIVFLLRNPIDRAWSHALMNLVKLSGQRFEDITEARFLEHFRRAEDRGRYTAMLDVWTRYFDESQVHVGFFEEIRDDPQALLGAVCRHIGAPEIEGWEGFPFRERVNAGRSIPIPDRYRTFLQEMYRGEIESLHVRFGSRIEDWRRALMSHAS